MPEVYVVDDPAPNAFATGRDPEHAMVAATTGLLDIMTDAELKGVMAHELGHVRNYDIRVSMVVYGLVVAVGMISDVLVRMAFFGRNNNGNNPVVLVFGLVAMLVAPLVASLAARHLAAAGIPRRRHGSDDDPAPRRARERAAQAGRIRQAAAEAAQQHGAPLDRRPLKPGLTQRLFATHPPIPDRIRRLLDMGGASNRPLTEPGRAGSAASARKAVPCLERLAGGGGRGIQLIQFIFHLPDKL